MGNKDVKGVFAALRTIAYPEVKKTEKFVIPQLTTLKLKHKPARKAGTKVMFGKEVKVAAKPASKVVKAFPAKALKDSKVMFGKEVKGAAKPASKVVKAFPAKALKDS